MTRNKAFSFILCVLFLYMMQGLSAAATLWVNSNDQDCDDTGDSLYCTIQECIDAAQNGDECLVRPATYVEAIDFLGKNIVLRSDDDGNAQTVDIAASTTIIQAPNAPPKVSVVTFENSEPSTTELNGFTIENGSGTEIIPDMVPDWIDDICGECGMTAGGGIYCVGADPTIKNCIIRNNSVEGTVTYDEQAEEYNGYPVGVGAGVFCQSSEALITDCTIYGNEADGLYDVEEAFQSSGGGLFCSSDGEGDGQDRPTLVRCAISGNSAEWGGGIFVVSCAPIIQYSTITENEAKCYGGGIGVDDLPVNAQNPLVFSITNTLISGNEIVSWQNHPDPGVEEDFSDGAGMAVFVSGGQQGIGKVQLVNSSIVGNVIQDTDYEGEYEIGKGGGLYIMGSLSEFTNSTIAGNKTWASGGGVYALASGAIFANTSISDNFAQLAGGGVYCVGDSSEVQGGPTFTSCDIERNRVVAPSGPAIGGGICSGLYAANTITNCNIRENSVISDDDNAMGGGIAFNELSTLQYNVTTVTGGTVKGNSAVSNEGSAVGGGLVSYGLHNDLEITGVTVEGNSVVGDGEEQTAGGVMLAGNSSYATLTDCTIRNNTAAGGGGGVVFTLNDASTLIGCTITGNTSFVGGGTFIFQSSPTFTNCMIVENVGFTGGAIVSNGSEPVFQHCTLSANAANSGAGVASDVMSQYEPTITNSIVYGNIPDEIGGDATVTYSDVRGGWTGTGNIDVDPLFIGLGDYHLTTDASPDNSPCEDTGQTSSVDEDIDEEDRPQGSGPDMGADEVPRGS